MASATSHRSDDERSRRFAQAITHGISGDFIPFTSPAAAVEGAAVVITGSVRELVREASNPSNSLHYVVFRVEVDEVVSGELQGAKEVALLYRVSGIASLDEIREALPLGPGVFVLDELSDWEPRHSLVGAPEGPL